MRDDFPENYSGIQEKREDTSSIPDYRNEILAALSGTFLAGTMIAPTEISEEAYGPSELYEDANQVAYDLLLEGSSFAQEGLETSFDIINSFL